MKQFRFSLIFLGCLLPMNICAQTVSSPAQNPDYDIVRISTQLVTVPVTVKTREGGYITNLRVEDFLSEDGVLQKISYFESVEKPFTVVLMLDVSDSTQVRFREIQNPALAFLKQLKPEDRGIVIAFDKQLARMAVVSSDHEVLARAIRAITTGGGTALYDSLQWVISSQLTAISGRKAIVLLTDGIDTSSVRATYAGTIDLASAQYALIYPIQWETPDDLLAKQLARSANLENSTATYTTNSEKIS